MLNTQIMLLLIMCLGFFLRRKGIVDAGGKRLLADLVVYVTLPASIIKSFQVEFRTEIVSDCIVVILVAVVIQIGCYALGKYAYPNASQERKGVLHYATLCSNAGILGNAMAEGIFGAMGLLYASVYVIPQRIFMWSLGLACFTKAGSRWAVAKQVLTHPCIIAVFVGAAMMGFGILLPECLNLTVRNVANANTFAAMLLVGAILAEIPLDQLVEPISIYYAWIRLGLIPLLVCLGCGMAGVNELVTNISVLLSGMPAASTTVALASKYQKDELFATKCVAFTTILSMVTVPLWCIALHTLR